MHILQWKGSKFCVQFQIPYKFWAHTQQNMHFTDFYFCVWFTITPLKFRTNFEPIHHKICILLTFIFVCDLQYLWIVTLSETGPWSLVWVSYVWHYLIIVILHVILFYNSVIKSSNARLMELIYLRSVLVTMNFNFSLPSGNIYVGYWWFR